ncbi:hypothetical protein, partial [Xanthomonas campestris]
MNNGDGVGTFSAFQYFFSISCLKVQRAQRCVSRGSVYSAATARSLVAPEKPPITQRPQGLDVCSGVPELP